MIIYVNQAAGREGNGSKEMPFRNIAQAAKIAEPGDVVRVYPGVYREYVDPVNGGTEKAPIVYESTEPLGAVITGAEPAKGWKRQDGTTWVLRVSNAAFAGYNPYTTYVYGDWYFAPRNRHTGAVYLNDRQLYEAESLAECMAGQIYEPSWEQEYSVYKWYTEQDGDETVIYANFQGKDPNEENVEINVRRECFFPSKTGRNYITFRGFVVTKAATTWAPPAAFQDGAIGPHWSKGWIIEDCEISNSKCCGISLGKYLDPENDHYFTYKRVKSPTQMERDAVCRGQYHGWLKENIGHHVVRRCEIYACEQAGIVGRQGCVFSLIEDNHIHHINNMQQLGGAEISGIKLHAAIDVIFRRNHIHHSTMGIWCDWEAQGTRITGNLLHDNQRPAGVPESPGTMECQDIFIEVSHGPTLIDNNIMLSQASLRMATQGIAMVHNLCAGALTKVGSGTDNPGKPDQARYTPYHIRHRTEVAGFMSILHGDDRFYNNIFIQHWPLGSIQNTEKENEIAGTAVFDDYPTYEEWHAPFEKGDWPDMNALAVHHFGHLPVWCAGNVYLAGAKAWKKEKNAFVNETAPVTLKLIEKDGKVCLETNLYELLDGAACEMISSQTLGLAFEPEQAFENPDGTPILFDSDYLGSHRGLEVLAGPFASKEDAKKPLF